ncbi:IS5 family transposase [Brachymonas denitrificans]|nr:IS5 family transposase [Brachymonas denitrificans]
MSLTRRQLLGAAGAASLYLYGCKPTAVSQAVQAASGAASGASAAASAPVAIDYKTFTGTLFHADHYGPFMATITNGKLEKVTPTAHDKMPTPMLTDGVLARTYDKTRIAGPMVQDRCITPRKPNKPCSNDSRRMIAMDSFFLMGAKPLVQDSPSMKLHELLDWHSIAGHLKGLYQREKSGAGGPEPYNRLGMFKLMLLGQWHGLSDAQLEQALRVRLDFMVFTGFEPSAGELPDASTICRFRNRLVTAGLDQNLLTLINGQLEQLGLKVQGARGAIIDATIIPSAARPNRYLEEGQPAQVIDSPDAEARWVKKGKDAFFGYRGHTAVDSEDGYVEHVQVRPANEAEITRLPDIVDALKPGVVAVLADKGYASKANRQFLQERGIGDLIQHKGSRGHPLHPLYSQFNKKIGAIRFKVEQAFGTMKRRFNLARARYFGTAKVQAQMCWAALGMNLLKAHRKLKAMELAGVGAP